MDIVEVHGETRSNLISVTLFNLSCCGRRHNARCAARYLGLKPLTLRLPDPAKQRPAQQYATSTVHRLSP